MRIICWLRGHIWTPWIGCGPDRCRTCMRCDVVKHRRWMP